MISGLGGEEAFSKSFHDWSTSLIDSAVASGVPEANVVYLAEDPARDTERIDGAARKETIDSTLQKMGESAGAGGELWIVIFGHGSARGDEATVNLPGPDLSGSELAAMIERLPVERVAIANASSASADFVERLSAPGRAIVTATRTLSERHAPAFGGFFSEGFAEQRADVDKDERVSLLEAFDYARIAVARAFEEDGRMATEHPMLDDNGDRKGSLEPKATGDVDGLLASRLFLGSDSGPGLSSPELDQLRAKKNELEGRIAELRAQRKVTTTKRSTCASSRRCCSISRAPTRRSSGWREPRRSRGSDGRSARSWGVLLALLVGAASSLACGVEAGAQDPAAEARRRPPRPTPSSRRMQAAGALQEAVQMATARVEAEPDSLEARLEWAKALSAVGRYQDVATGLTAFLDRYSDTAHAGPRGVRFPLGSALAEVGRYDEARRTFEAEVEARGPDRLASLAALGEIALATGDRRERLPASTRSSTPTTTAALAAPPSFWRWRPRAVTWARPIRSSSRTRSRPSTRRSPPTGARSRRASR